MSNYNNSRNNSFEKTVHWRKLKEALELLMCHEGLDSADYDLDHMACYETRGLQIQGSNVTYFGTERGLSPFNFSQSYRCFEARKKSSPKDNIGKYSYVTGEFILFAYDVDSDYWVLCTMTYHFDDKLNSIVTYRPYGYYEISFEPDPFINVLVRGSGCAYGGHGCQKYFYQDSIRLKGYHTSMATIRSAVNNHGASNLSVSGGKNVKVYKKKKKNYNKHYNSKRNNYR